MKLSLVKVRLNKGGYEVGSGRYYGVGLPVYRAAVWGTGEVMYEGRHATRAEAKAAILKLRSSFKSTYRHVEQNKNPRKASRRKKRPHVWRR